MSEARGDGGARPAAALEPEALVAEARAQTGLEDFGEPDFREGLAVLCETYAAAGLSERRARRERRRLLGLLATRLRVEAAFRRHPEIRERPVRAPLYLTGFPRTGTSALFNLLGMDPASRPLLLWEGIFPDPPAEPVPDGEEDPRLTLLRRYYEDAIRKNPDFAKIHEARADLPEECVMLLAHTFCDVQVGVEVLMEPYASWFQRQDLAPAYRYYADLLRMLDWQRPGERWLLKSPAHLWALDVLVELFPDAGVVLTHREPTRVVASYCSMMEALSDGIGRFDPVALGPVVLEYLARKMERGLAARDRSDPARFLDVDHRAFVADPMATVRRIHDHFALPLPAAAEAAMRTHVARNPRGKHGEHRYDLGRFGLSTGAVRERLRDYRERFDLPAGGAAG